MGNVLALCETSGSALRTNALSNLSFARQAAEKHGGDVVALLIGKGVSEAAADACKYAKKVVVVDDDALEHPMAETYAPIVARVASEQGATVITATASSIGKDVIPRVAALTDSGMASDIASIESTNTFRRPILAGNAYSTVEISTDIICVTARQTEFDAATELDAPGESITAEAGELNTYGAEFVSLSSSKSDRPDLNDAAVVVSGGRGMKSAENFKNLEQLADLLGAAMGASRAVTDAGWVPPDWQVGQTGKIVAPDLYFAVAISGAIQHLAGMKSSKTIVAINKDPEAPIFQVADYGVVTTWEKALPELIEEIKKLQAAQT
jgi:electron transfer flavoprotein alpha subunit